MGLKARTFLSRARGVLAQEQEAEEVVETGVGGPSGALSRRTPLEGLLASLSLMLLLLSASLLLLLGT